MKNYKIAVAGTGYVGLSLGVLLSQHHQVVAVDIVQASAAWKRKSSSLFGNCWNDCGYYLKCASDS